MRLSFKKEKELNISQFLTPFIFNHCHNEFRVIFISVTIIKSLNGKLINSTFELFRRVKKKKKKMKTT